MDIHRDWPSFARADTDLTTPGRAELEARWLELTRETLPALAVDRPDWPIRLDHCFMRVCLDAAVGARWDTRVRRPAIRHLTDEQLAQAVDYAQCIRTTPSRLPDLNRQSLRMRGKL